MITAWTRFLAKIETAIGSLDFRPGEEAYFRGHTSLRHKLLPSLFRPFADEIAEDKKADAEVTKKIRKLESDLFYEFAGRARELDGLGISDWDVLFWMQHYGTPTRLLDWTEVLGVAVYFALLNVRDDATDVPCVWVLNPYVMNETHGKMAATKGRKPWPFRDLVAPTYLGWDFEAKQPRDFGHIIANGLSFRWEYPVAIYPRKKSQRLHAQRGSFTIHGNDCHPLEKSRKRKAFLRKVPLPRAAFGDARRFLSTAGIDTHLLFPELDGLSRHLREKYGLIPPAQSLPAMKERKQ